MRRHLSVAVATLVVAAGAATAFGAPSSHAVSPTHRSYRWSGALTSLTSETTDLRVDVPAAYWARHPGGVTIRVDWTARDTELDLHVTDAQGHELAQSIYGGRTFQQVYLYQPARGTYTVEVAGVVGVNAAYRASATLVDEPVRAARLVRGDMRFQQGLVDAQVLAKEPGIDVGEQGRTYVVASWGLTSATSMAWTSGDGGQSYTLRSATTRDVPSPSPRPCPEIVGGADSDIAVDRTGRLYFAALASAEVAIGYSVDHGQTWTCSPIGSTIPENDRPWLATAPTADGSGPGLDAYLVYHDLALGQLPVGQETKPVQIHVDATTDGGATWESRSAYGRGLVPFAGPVFVAADGTVYQTFQAGNAAWLASSTDQAKTFTLHRVAQRQGDAGNTWVTGAVDRAGRVYVAWVDGGSYQTLYSYSRDKGAHWSAPVRVSAPGQLAMLPWVSAGAAGDVAISWYGADAAGVPDLVPATTRWHAFVARSSNAATATPTFELATLSDSTVHLGPVCTPCTGDHGNLGDMLETAITRDGQLVAAFNDNARPDAAYSTPYPYVVVARQTAGRGMTGSALARAKSVAEPRGDAGNVAPLDLTGLPTAARSGSSLRIGLDIASAKDLGAAVSSPSTDAYWLVLWKAHDRVEYAGLRVGSDGEPEFFGGDAPVGIEASGAALTETLARQLYAAYPAKFALHGSVDAAHGRVRIDLPLAQFHLGAGDTLRRLQAFTFTGMTSQRTPYTMLTGVDSSPARVVALR